MILPQRMGPSIRESLHGESLTVLPDGVRFGVVRAIELDKSYQVLQVRANELARNIAEAEKSGTIDRSACAQLNELKEKQRNLPIIRNTQATVAEILATDLHSQTLFNLAKIKPKTIVKI